MSSTTLSSVLAWRLLPVAAACGIFFITAALPAAAASTGITNFGIASSGIANFGIDRTDKATAAGDSQPAPVIIADTIAVDLTLAPSAQSRMSNQPAKQQQQLHQPGAEFIKVRFSQFNLPKGAYVTVADPAGHELYRYEQQRKDARTYDRQQGQNGEQQFAAMSVNGDTAVVTLVLPNPAAWQLQHQVRIDAFYAGLTEPVVEPGLLSTCGGNERRDAVCAVNSHPQHYDRSRPVARLLIGGSGLCTGWRVGSDNHLLTNNHCVQTAGELSNTEVWFNYQNSQCGVRSLGSTVKVTGKDLLKTDYTLDYTLFSVNNFATIASFGHLGLTNSMPSRGETIFIPQHGAGNPKELAITSDFNNSGLCEIDVPVTSGRASGTDTGYMCDTIGGSSGSPVIAAASNNAIALHHFGGCPNQGVLVAKIWPQIASFFQNRLPVGDQPGNGDNQPPLAEFQLQCSGFDCTVDGSTSSDADGTINSYQWLFGDGTSGAGIQASHSYLLPGRYSLQLTVTDNDGAQHSKTRAVTVSDPRVYPLTAGVALNGLNGEVEQDRWYQLTTTTANSRVTIAMSGGTGNAQLSVKTGSQPTDSSYDCRPQLAGNNESCSIYLNQAGTVFVRLFGATSYANVQLLADVQQTPPTGFPKTGLAAASTSWLRYQYQVPAGTTQLLISTSGGTGDADLYVQKSAPPSTSVYDCRPYKSGNTESCTLQVNGGDVVHIGVRAYRSFTQLTLDVK